ncbi:MAG: hypothetical protein JWR63_2573, partial [Conexibacter sp.]|nr:hypothetical protein [Conexibacter sp.]
MTDHSFEQELAPDADEAEVVDALPVPEGAPP